MKKSSSEIIANGNMSAANETAPRSMQNTVETLEALFQQLNA